MTRPNKHAARFGARYQPPIDWRRFRDGLQKAQPAIHRMTEAFRQVADNMRRAREMEQTARQVEAIINGPLVSADRYARGGHIPAADALRAAGWAIWQRPPEGVELGEDGRYRATNPRVLICGGDILDRIDDTLLTYDSQHATGDQPWPYRGF